MDDLWWYRLAQPAAQRGVGGEPGDAVGQRRRVVRGNRVRGPPLAARLQAAFPDVGHELVAWARATGVHEHPQLGRLLYASSERAGAGSFE
jgi:hypothetical protein